MKLRFWVVAATLNKVNSMYLSVETSSEQQRCAAAIHKAWVVYHLMTWKSAVNVLRFLAELVFLLDRLKDYFNFYHQPYSVCRICIQIKWVP